jgi:hypothetical protein
VVAVHHPSVTHLLNLFRYEHLPPHLQAVSKPCHDLAQHMAETGDGIELTVGLRKLLESKDCFVRAHARPGDHHGTRIEGGETYQPNDTPD